MKFQPFIKSPLKVLTVDVSLLKENDDVLVI